MRDCHCQLCGRLPATDPLSAAVVQKGWTVVTVPDEGPRPAYAYTVGLWHSFSHAEASVFGREEKEMIRWLDTVGGHVAAGRVLHPVSGERPQAPGGSGERPETPGGGPGGAVMGPAEVFPRPALASWHRHLFGTALDFYRGQPVPMLQLVWSDQHGVLPWEPGCAEGCLAAQPRLWDLSLIHI